MTDQLPAPTGAPVDFGSPSGVPVDLPTPLGEPTFPPPAGEPVLPPPAGGPVQFEQPPIPPQPKKSKKKLFIILGAAVLLILIVVGGFVGYDIYRTSVYNGAAQAMQDGDYQKAYDTFVDLGDYKDAPRQVKKAQDWLDYTAAKALFDAQDYQAAKTAFETMGRFEDSKDWVNKCSYAIAEGKLAAGNNYEAFLDFKKLGSFEDAASRMATCTTPYPDTGVLYFNGGFASTRSAIAIDGANTSEHCYFKLYSGDTLVSNIFVNPGGRVEIELTPGTYTLKEATGLFWFGEEIMFGEDGYYEVLLFNGGNNYFDLGDNIISTITMSVSDGNTGSQKTNREGF